MYQQLLCVCDIVRVLYKTTVVAAPVLILTVENLDG